jgi:hypothetical protein
MVLDLSENPISTPLDVRTEGGAIVVGRSPWRDNDPLIELSRYTF